MAIDAHPDFVTEPRPRGGELSEAEERYYMASQLELMWRKFRRHRLAMVSSVLLIVLYIIAFTAEFWTPHESRRMNQDFLSAPPTPIHFFDEEGKFRGPFVYGSQGELDFETFVRVYTEDKDVIHPIHFFCARSIL